MFELREPRDDLSDIEALRERFLDCGADGSYQSLEFDYIDLLKAESFVTSAADHLHRLRGLKSEDADLDVTGVMEHELSIQKTSNYEVFATYTET